MGARHAGDENKKRGDHLEAIAIVTFLALLQYTMMGYKVGQMRVKHGVKAPAMSGHPEFERVFRIQQNTMEQLVVFLPALWMYGYFQDPIWGAGIGLVFVIGRFVYQRSYFKDPASRGTGFLLGLLSWSILLVGSLIGAGKVLYVNYFTV